MGGRGDHAITRQTPTHVHASNLQYEVMRQLFFVALATTQTLDSPPPPFTNAEKRAVPIFPGDGIGPKRLPSWSREAQMSRFSVQLPTYLVLHHCK